MLKSSLNFIAKHFKDNTSTMIIWTGAIGWALSSMAQICGILFNSKTSKKDKSFLLPQELVDAITNIALFIGVTTVAKFSAKKLFTTGKLAPKSVHEYLKKNTELANKIGKADFNIDNIYEKLPAFPAKQYDTYKNFGTTVATLGAGIASTNVITPLIRNYAASNVQNKYVNAYPKSTDMRV